MPWFKVDDNLSGGDKVGRIPRGRRRAALGLWVLAGSWSARYLRDGVVPAHMIAELTATEADARTLVECGLWHSSGHDCGDCIEVAPGDYLFHDWSRYQPTRAKVESAREAAAERQRKAREKSAESRALADVSQRDEPEQVRESQRDTRDVTVLPTRPDPTPSKEASREIVTSVDARDANASPNCSAHEGMGDTAPACGGCARAREHHDVVTRRRNAERASADAAQRAADRAAEVARCRLCDDAGYVGTAVCHHNPHAAGVAAVGAAAVRAARTSA